MHQKTGENRNKKFSYPVLEVYKADGFERACYFSIKYKRKLKRLAVILNMLEETITKLYIDKFETYCILKYNKICERHYCFYMKSEKRR